jgi:hypothetical protein
MPGSGQEDSGMRASGPLWTISGVRRERDHGVYRVRADVAGHPLWFESADVELEPSLEAFANLLFLPALHHGAIVAVDRPLDPTWLDGTRRLPALLAAWWGYPEVHPIQSPERAPAASTRAAAVASCFTGGVDSFYTLLTCGDRLSRLVFVHGYDIPLADHVRMTAFERSLRAVSERIGKPALILRTNVREHPIVASVNWERTHGAALAAAAHVLSGAIGGLIIPTSYSLSSLIPWGSHPATDPLWSTSRVEIFHDDLGPRRQDKIRRIVGNPLVWRHLRVCWENRAPTGNCSECLKCIRTMIGISVHGQLTDFTVFDLSVPLASRLDALPGVPEHLRNGIRNLLELDLPPDVRRAVLRLLGRSRPGLLRRIARRMRPLSRRDRS